MADEDVVAFDKELEERVISEFGDTATPEFMNLLRLGKAAYEHGYFGFIPVEKVVEWVKEMYIGGQKQRSIRGGGGNENEMININSADVMNAASFLDLYGEERGYLSKGG
ncbi:MAG: hypothetical protein M1165_02880 [Candidatus Pacearchaeota archaeon]|nr:hypothetical protein [Candidatus Pacearchaeota archaeon]MDE1848900.1 hypothetical protein [Nanoarchaeota archaeon]